MDARGVRHRDAVVGQRVERQMVVPRRDTCEQFEFRRVVEQGASRQIELITLAFTASRRFS